MDGLQPTAGRGLPRPGQEARRPIRVTLIVPIFNPGRTLEGCLQALAGLNPFSDQVFLVDNGSNDRRYERLAAFADGHPRRGALEGSPSWPRPKLLEAAAGLPIVTTRVGIEGIEASDGQHVVISDNPAVFISTILHPLAKPEERQRLGQAARRLAEDRYDWWRCLAPLQELYATLLPLRGSRC